MVSMASPFPPGVTWWCVMTPSIRTSGMPLLMTMMTTRIMGICAPPLALIPPIPKNIEIDRDSARKNPAQALMAAFSKAARSSDSVTATGTLNVSRYGRLLKSRHIVGVRGAGPAFDGLYYVSSVTHSLKRGEFKQQFTLVRNGLVSITPRVPV